MKSIVLEQHVTRMRGLKHRLAVLEEGLSEVRRELTHVILETEGLLEQARSEEK